MRLNSIKLFFVVFSDSWSSLPWLPCRLFSENFQGGCVAVQRFGHSLSWRTFTLQAFVTRTFEEKLCRSAQEEDACWTERKLPEQSRVHLSRTRHQHIYPNQCQQLPWKWQQFRWSSIFVCASFTASNTAASQSSRQHTDQFTNWHTSSPHQRFSS